MTVRMLIVEDEVPARQKLRELVSELGWAECIGEAADGAGAIQMIDALEPDVVLLDIELPELSGLEVLRRIAHQPVVIFTTAYDRYAVSAFELQALDYLLKPFGRERFVVAAERARKALADSATYSSDAPPAAERAAGALAGSRPGSDPLTRVFVRDGGKITPISVRDIERLEAEDDYVALHVRGRRLLVYLPLAEFERRLDPAQFLRIHRSHIVNVDFVSHMEPFDSGRLQVTMRDGTVLMASRVRSRELRHLAI
jgi:two-component system, LytTR family, response regulator